MRCWSVSFNTVFCWSMSAELEQELRAGQGEGDEAQFIQDDEVLFQSVLQQPGQAVFILGHEQFTDQGGGVVETHAVALPTRCQRQSGSDVGLAHPSIYLH